MSALLSLSLCITTFFVLLLTKYVTSRKQHRYPPGPKPKPIIGNIRDLPTKDMANVFIEWGKKYNSSIVHGTTVDGHVVALNGLEDAVELFEKRATKYSDRPYHPLRKPMGWDHTLPSMRYGEEWRYHRKISNQIFHKGAVKNYHSVMLQKVHEMLDGLLQSPETFERHYKTLSASILMKTLYGYDVESIDDPWITRAEKSIMLGIELLVPAGSLVNLFPMTSVLAWFPGASSSKLAAKVKRLTEEVRRTPMDWARMRMNEGTAVPSVVTNFLEKKNTIGASQEEEEAIEHIAHTAYGAASHATMSATGSFLYYMAVNPGIQEKAQREIDRVVGRTRLPDFSDRPAMPYVEAIYREVMRSRPPSHMGAPHCAMEDDHYKEYFIPKGRAMTHDESAYPEPFAFKPERFFDKNGGLNDDDRILAYGFGLRGCAGKDVSSAILWLTFSSILATFNLGKAKDKSGKEIEINDEFEDFAMISQKKHFECSFTPRSREHQQLIEAANTSNK